MWIYHTAITNSKGVWNMMKMSRCRFSKIQTKPNWPQNS